MRSRDTRPISWIRAARKAFDGFPERPQNAIMRALTVAAEGRKADIAKPLKGFGSGVFEVALKDRTNAYRTVYALQLEERVWVVHAFQKKAKQGIGTPKKDIDLIGERLKRLKKELRQ
ncbi:MAG: type II toxin-antitoxin system RelE/ParE family toxin [Acidobacteriia bacterium]|nr:type II toxin-antitoxin system RelE/ParE family toxin [Terriglobia bacterium]